jgi:hypothetical protein
MAWLPTLFIIVLTAAAVTEAGSPPGGRAVRRLWMAGILLLGLLAIAGSVTEQRRTAALIADAVRPAALPAAGGTDHDEAGNSELARRMQNLQEQLRETTV